MKTIIFAGGGTAGHIEPALAVAAQWMKENPADKCIFIGTSQGLETTLVPAAGFTLRTIKKVVLARRFSPGVLLLPLNLLQAMMQARSIIKGSSLLIGFGGYVSAASYLAAKSCGVPIVIHEANARPGIANRLGTSFTSALAVSTPVQRGPFSKALITGMPLKSSITEIITTSHSDWNLVRSQAKRTLGFDDAMPLVLVVGGSQGSQAMNTVIAQSLSSLLEKKIQVMHSLGRKNVLPNAQSGYQPHSYIADMATAYLAADVIISRSGAVTCSEFEALGKFALFIPLAIGNGEQLPNAEHLANLGRARVISQKDFTSAWLLANIDSLLSSSKARGAQVSTVNSTAHEKITALMQNVLSSH
ncbi:MAG: UDP-N-acetylglucosamine--N-acetylmuramyl-(pentapeptide) pyrophosphoryl-undecaprenol N-acetylglucosamine transferase [Actinomycetes bacterium]|jgi:UDP-N-acetylglucosamine--N-acetylmuramyl-(pentapeptide) pyrophosphoryl-undecaprenol N-acetylglucosamine transferase